MPHVLIINTYVPRVNLAAILSIVFPSIASLKNRHHLLLISILLSSTHSPRSNFKIYLFHKYNRIKSVLRSFYYLMILSRLFSALIFYPLHLSRFQTLDGNRLER
ncbi:unnamed protein product [Lactuca virosa]|uniref:Uncharacterized protein n=1 Tax=Lactuca virosa TaxID=75947 RepID=A0AAU9LPP3_9ASTR|nr:unnamed protein product [Lactuca virosa]